MPSLDPNSPSTRQQLSAEVVLLKHFLGAHLDKMTKEQLKVELFQLIHQCSMDPPATLRMGQGQKTETCADAKELFKGSSPSTSSNRDPNPGAVLTSKSAHAPTQVVDTKPAKTDSQQASKTVTSASTAASPHSRDTETAATANICADLALTSKEPIQVKFHERESKTLDAVGAGEPNAKDEEIHRLRFLLEEKTKESAEPNTEGYVSKQEHVELRKELLQSRKVRTFLTEQLNTRNQGIREMKEKIEQKDNEIRQWHQWYETYCQWGHTHVGDTSAAGSGSPSRETDDGYADDGSRSSHYRPASTCPYDSDDDAGSYAPPKKRSRRVHFEMPLPTKSDS